MLHLLMSFLQAWYIGDVVRAMDAQLHDHPWGVSHRHLRRPLIHQTPATTVAVHQDNVVRKHWLNCYDENDIICK